MPSDSKGRVIKKKPSEDISKKGKGGIAKEGPPESEKKAKTAGVKAKGDSKDPAAWFARGLAHREGGRTEEALKCFEEVIKLRPDHKGAWSAKANVLASLDRFVEAADCYKRVLEMSSKGAGTGYTRSKTEEKAVEEMLTEIVDDDLESKYDHQLNALNERIGRNPRDTEAWFEKAIVLSKMGKYREAIEMLNEVTRLDMKNPDVWRMKGDLFSRLDETKKAVQSYQRANELLRSAVRCPMCSREVEGSPNNCPNCGSKLDVQKDFEYDMSVWSEDAEQEKTLAQMAPVESPEEKPGEKTGTEGEGVSPESSRPPSTKQEEKKQDGRHVIKVWSGKRGLVSGKTGKVIEAPDAKVKVKGPQKPSGKTSSGAISDGIGKTNGLISEPGKIKGLVNGRGRTNGLVNGKGRINGMINGMGRTNGLVNGTVAGTGLINGSGVTNGTRLGRVNGIVNGRGRVNGLLNGKGATNGLAKDGSAESKGIINGISFARSGLTNGLTNGTGMTNGLGYPRFQREAALNRRKIYLIPAVALLLLVSSVSFVIPNPQALEGITIDGSFSDWDGRTTPMKVEVGTNPSTDIVGAGVEGSADFVSFFIETRGLILKGGNDIVDTFHVFMDSDMNSATGYRIDDLGADHMLTVYGKDGAPMGSYLSRFGSTGCDDWSGWMQVQSARSSASENKLEAQLDWESIGEGPMNIATLFYAQSHTKDEDFGDDVLSNSGGTLRVVRESLAAQELQGDGNDLLALHLEALRGDIELNGLTVELTGTASEDEVSSVRLSSQDEGTISTQIPSSKEVEFQFSAPLHIPRGQTEELVVSADVLGASGNTLGARIKGPGSFTISKGVASLSELTSDRSAGYIGTPSSSAAIDGGFAEWTNATTDLDPARVAFPGIDIQDYGLIANGSDAYLYMEVEDDLLGGARVPFWNLVRTTTYQSAPDRDRDTVPDEFDERPTDFNNQGLEDRDTGGDVDEDGMTDYPNGPDYWLNTTIPASFPAPYGGSIVRVYVGPVVKPPLTGEDTLRGYLDVDDQPGSGYSVDTIFADYMVQLTGKNGRVNNKSLYGFPASASPGDGNAWQLIGTVSEAHDRRSLEMAAGLPVPLNASTVKAFFEAENADRDISDEVSKSLEATKGGGMVVPDEQDVISSAWKAMTGSRPEGTKWVSTQIDPTSTYYTTWGNNQRKIVRAGDVAGDGVCDSTNSDGCWYVVFSEDYVDGSNSRVIIMRSNNKQGSSWGSQIILASGIPGDNPILLINQSNNPSIAIDSSGYIHLVWLSNTTEGTGALYTKYTKTTVAYPTQSELSSSSNWETVTLLQDSYYFTAPSISTDSQNAPHIALSYHSEFYLGYMNKVGGSWSSLVLWDEDYYYAGASVDVSPQTDYVSLVYYYKDGTYNDVRYKVCKDLSTSNCDATSEFIKWDGSSGSDTVATSVGTSAVDRFPTIATTYSSQGDLWVAYAKDVDASTSAIYARYLDYPSSGWQSEETVDSVANTKFCHPTIGVDPAGNVYAMYEDYDNVRSYVKIRAGGSWGSRTQIGTNAIQPVLIVRMPNSAGYGFDLAAVYQEYLDDTYHYYIPEFPTALLPVIVPAIIFPLMIGRWRIQRRRMKIQTSSLIQIPRSYHRNRDRTPQAQSHFNSAEDYRLSARG